MGLMDLVCSINSPPSKSGLISLYIEKIGRGYVVSTSMVEAVFPMVGTGVQIPLKAFSSGFFQEK